MNWISATRFESLFGTADPDRLHAVEFHRTRREARERAAERREKSGNHPRIKAAVLKVR